MTMYKDQNDQHVKEVGSQRQTTDPRRSGGSWLRDASSEQSADEPTTTARPRVTSPRGTTTLLHVRDGEHHERAAVPKLLRIINQHVCSVGWWLMAGADLF
jgi:hypothetical protein